MGLVSFKPPKMIAFSGSAPGYTGFTIDAAAEKFGMVIRAPRAGTLDKFEVRLGAVGQAPTNGLKFSFQDVSTADGNPDGTANQFRVVTGGITANAWVAPGLITSDGTDGGTKRTVAENELLGCVVEFESFNASDSVNFNGLTLATASAGAIQQAYIDLFTASWAKQTTALAVVALKYTTSPLYEVVTPDIIPASALNSTSFNNASSPDERGLIFQVPMPCGIYGFLVRYGPSAAGRNSELVLYDSDGTTVLHNPSIDGDQVQSTSARWLFVPVIQDILPAVNYRVVIKPTSANSVELQDFEVSTAAIMDAVGGGQNWHYTERTSAPSPGAWTETTTKRAWIIPCFGKFHDGTGAGGGIIRANMNGGIL